VRVKSETFILIAIFIVLFVLVVLPWVMIIYGSFRTAPPRVPGEFTVENYLRFFRDYRFISATCNSVLVGVGATAVSLFFGFPLSWIIARTNVPWRKHLQMLNISPLFVSPLLGAFAWSIMANPKAGYINILLRSIFNLSEGPINIYGFWGIILVIGIFYSPYVFLSILGPLTSMDSSLEEASLISGASTLHTFFRITTRLLLPSIAAGTLLVFVHSFTHFTTVIVLGTPVGFQVLTTTVFWLIRTFPSDYPQAAAICIEIISFMLIGLYLQRRLMASKGRFTVVMGRGARPPRVFNLGKWKYVALAFNLFYLLLVFLPFALLAVASFFPYVAAAWLEGPSAITLDNYKMIFELRFFRSAVVNSLFASSIAATLLTLLATSISYITLRTKLRGKTLVDYLSSLPLLLPGPILSIGLLWAWISIPGLYGTIWILILAYITHEIPTGVRLLTSNLSQIDVELEESSKVCGASIPRTFRRIIIPLLKPGLSAVWILTFIFAIREVGASMLLYSPGSEVISVALFQYIELGPITPAAALAMVQIGIIVTALYIFKKLTKTDVTSLVMPGRD
jgi:iron(III) transport system permease protein